MKLAISLSLAAMLVSGAASAEGVYNAKLATPQLQIQRDQRGFSQCGIRIVFMDQRTNVSDFYDLSVIIMPDQFTGLITVGKRVRPDSTLKPGFKISNAPQIAPTKVWIAKSTDSQPVVPHKTMTKNGQLFGAIQPAEAFSVILAMSLGEQMQVYAEYPEQSGRIVSLNAPLESKDEATLKECLGKMADRMQSTSDAIEAKPAQ